METPKIGELVARYDFPNGDYITLRSKDGKVRITSASMNTETGKEVTDAIADFKSRIELREPKKETEKEPINIVRDFDAMTRDFESRYPKQRKPATMFTDEQKADIIKRYQAGEGPTAISKSLGCSKSTIVHLISKAGVTEGRTGQHLKKKPEPQPEENEPV